MLACFPAQWPPGPVEGAVIFTVVSMTVTDNGAACAVGGIDLHSHLSLDQSAFNNHKYFQPAYLLLQNFLCAFLNELIKMSPLDVDVHVKFERFIRILSSFPQRLSYNSQITCMCLYVTARRDG